VRSPTSYKFRHYGKNPDPQGDGDVLLWASNGRDSIFPTAGELIIKGSETDLEVKHSQLWTPNALADEGEIDILDVYFEDQAVRATLYLRLYNSATTAEADTLTTIEAIGSGEESAGGYGNIAVARGTDWTAPTAPGGTTTPATGSHTFNATATWAAVQSMVLATVATGAAGLHIAWVNLSASRSLVNGDSLDTDLTVSLE
jgi:hypothetical protein